MRKHIYKLAATLSAAAHINADHVYDFLASCGRDLGKDPAKLTWTTGIGIIFLAGHRDDYCLEAFRPEDRRPAGDDEAARYWEDRILARQEAWMD